MIYERCILYFYEKVIIPATEDYVIFSMITMRISTMFVTIGVYMMWR